jgi:pyroglutamyl-peptidase
MKLLLTGFEAFPGYPNNPTEWIVGRLAKAPPPDLELVAQVLAVDYNRADRDIRQLIRESQPDAVLALGLVGKSEKIRLERVALNLDDAEKSDNDGVIKEGTPIVVEGPAAYFSSLPLAALRAALAAAGMPVRFSNHAGAYLCNHVFYAALNEVEALGFHIPAGFIHLPQAAEFREDGSGLPLERLLEAVLIAIRVLLEDRGG